MIGQPGVSFSPRIDTRTSDLNGGGGTGRGLSPPGAGEHTGRGLAPSCRPPPVRIFATAWQPTPPQDRFSRILVPPRHPSRSMTGVTRAGTVRRIVRGTASSAG